MIISYLIFKKRVAYGATEWKFVTDFQTVFARREAEYADVQAPCTNFSFILFNKVSLFFF